MNQVCVLRREVYPNTSCVRSRSLLRTKPHVCPLPEGSEAIVPALGNAYTSPRPTPIPLCPDELISVLGTDVMLGKRLWVGTAPLAQGFLGSPLAQPFPGSGSDSDGGMRRAGRRAWAGRAAAGPTLRRQNQFPLWLGAGDLDPSVHGSHWIVGAHS